MLNPLKSFICKDIKEDVIAGDLYTPLTSLKTEGLFIQSEAGCLRSLFAIVVSNPPYQERLKRRALAVFVFKELQKKEKKYESQNMQFTIGLPLVYHQFTIGLPPVYHWFTISLLLFCDTNVAQKF